MSSSQSTSQLDHLILLLPHTTLKNLPQSISSHFTITPGGTHADGKTTNKLLVFRDGSYIELISFVDDSASNKAGHWWGGKKNGWIDWAVTTNVPGEGDYLGLLERIKTEPKIGYAEPQFGSRMRDDGNEVKWNVTFPQGTERGRVPFFCHDVTQRMYRVPVEKKNTSHPSGAVGLKRIEVIVPDSDVQELGAFYAKVLGTQPEKSGSKLVFRTGSVHGVSGTRDPAVVVRGPESEDEKRKVKERVLVGPVVVAVAAEEWKGGEERIRVDTKEDLGGWYLEKAESGDRERSGRALLY